MAKATEIPQLDFDVPSEWRTVSVGEVTSGSRRTIDPQDFADEEFDYYSIPAYQDGQSPAQAIGSTILSVKQVVEDGAVLFGKLNPRVHKVWRVNHPSQRRKIATTEFIVLNPYKDAVDSEFLYFLCWTNHVLSAAKELVSGSTPSRQRVDVSAFRRLPIPLPPLQEQRAIAHVLRTVQQAKETTAKVIAAARQLKASLMRHFFTYGPVPMAEADQVELREAEGGICFPANWEFTTVGDVAKLQYGYRTSIPKAPRPNGVRIISTAEITNEGILDLSKLRTVEVPQHLVERYTVHRNDILFNWRNAQEHVGKTALIEEEYRQPTTFASFIIRIIAGPKVNHRFLHFLISHLRQERVFFKQSRRAVNQANFNANELAAVKIALPHLKQQVELADWLASIDRQVKVVRSKQAALDAVSSTLLHELMTGTRRVHEIAPPEQKKKPKRSALADIFGKWPGDETDEQVRKALEEMD